MLQPQVRAVRVRRVHVHHRGVGPAGGAFLRHRAGDRLLLRLQQVDLEAPGRGGHHALVLEVVDLDHRVVPVAGHQLALLAQQVERSLVLILVQLVGVLDAQLRLGLHQVQGRIGDVDRAVEGLHPSLVRLAVRQGGLLEHDLPAGGRCLEDVRVVGEHVVAPLVGHAVVLAVHVVPGRLLQARVDVLEARDQTGVDFLHASAGDQAQAGIAGGGHQVEAALVHQRDHLVRGVGGLDPHLAAGLLLEVGDPVVALVRLAALDVTRPGDDVDGAFALAELVHARLSRCGGQGGASQRSRHSGQTRTQRCSHLQSP